MIEKEERGRNHNVPSFTSRFSANEATTKITSIKKVGKARAYYRMGWEMMNTHRRDCDDDDHDEKTILVRVNAKENAEIRGFKL